MRVCNCSTTNPLMGWMKQGLLQLAEATGVPFRVLFKLPTLVADVACLGMTLRPPLGQSSVGPKETTVWIAMAVFACNPIGILVTAFHGNTDS